MNERYVVAGWWIAVMGLVSAMGLGSLVLGYGGMLTMMSGSISGLGPVAVGLLLGVGAWALCRHRRDLMG
jgi:hypothetical protein